MSTLDDFQKRIGKLEKDIEKIKGDIEALKLSIPKPESPKMPEASDFKEVQPSPEEVIAEEAVAEAHVEQ